MDDKPELVVPLREPVGAPDAALQQLQDAVGRARNAQEAINNLGAGAPPEHIVWRGTPVTVAAVLRVLDAASAWHEAPFGGDTKEQVQLIEALEQLELEL